MVGSAEDPSWRRHRSGWPRGRRTHRRSRAEVRRLDPAQARELFPALAPELSAVHLSGAEHVDGHLLRRALLAAAERRGAKFVEGEVAFRADGTVAGEQGPLEADSVVVAAGAWAASCWPRSASTCR